MKKDEITRNGIYFTWLSFICFLISAWFFGFVTGFVSRSFFSETTETTGTNVEAVTHDLSIYLQYLPEWEVKEIFDAAYRNDLDVQLIPILAAIRKAENGGPGLEFGIMAPGADTYSKQAGGAACTVRNNYKRWLDAGCPGTFIDFLGDRYCPASVDPEGNVNWKKNVKYWTDKFNER